MPAIGDKINFNLVGLGTAAILYLNSTLFDKKEGDELGCGIIHFPKHILTQQISPIFPAEFEMSSDPMLFLLKKDYKLDKTLLQVRDTIDVDRFRSDSEDSLPALVSSVEDRVFFDKYFNPSFDEGSVIQSQEDQLMYEFLEKLHKAISSSTPKGFDDLFNSLV